MSALEDTCSSSYCLALGCGMLPQVCPVLRQLSALLILFHSSAFLPSSFAMYTTMMAFSYAVAPTSSRTYKRTLYATLFFATGAIVGWPFALALAIPFVFEELFLAGADQVTPESQSTWFAHRWTRLITAGAASALIFIPVIAIDTLAYGKLSIVPWNIIQYNLLGGANRGPDLYGTSPWHFYLLNLNLNFNVITPFALVSLPALAITYVFDRKRLGVTPASSTQSSPFTLLVFRLAPFYLWLGILTSQAHKEERFMFPAYPLLCFNAAVTLYLVRGWMEVAFISATKSPYRASKTSIFRTFTSSVIFTAAAISASRIVALYVNYHAPLSLAFTFEYEEIPRLLNQTGHLILPANASPGDSGGGYQIDTTAIKELKLNMCLSKEWHRFPSHFLIPSGIRVDWVKSEFDGMLPRHFMEATESDRMAKRLGLDVWTRPETRSIPDGLNDLNKEDPRHYVSANTCDYLIDLDFPQDPVSSLLEPRYVADTETWEVVSCIPFLDARHSPLVTRVLWMPGETWQSLNTFGDYCLLRNKKTIASKVGIAKEAMAKKSS
jgi:alpha-1,2-mannosyltransferase